MLSALCHTIKLMTYECTQAAADGTSGEPAYGRSPVRARTEAAANGSNDPKANVNTVSASKLAPATTSDTIGGCL